MAARSTAARAATTRAETPRPPSSTVSRVADLDRVIHERVRLAIVSALAVSDHLTFSELKEIVRTTDGNLSVHTRRLEEAGYVSCRKSFEKRKPLTVYRITKAGRQALSRYLDHMEALIRATRGE